MQDRDRERPAKVGFSDCGYDKARCVEPPGLVFSFEGIKYGRNPYPLVRDCTADYLHLDG